MKSLYDHWNGYKLLYSNLLGCHTGKRSDYSLFPYSRSMTKRDAVWMGTFEGQRQSWNKPWGCAKIIICILGQTDNINYDQYFVMEEILKKCSRRFIFVNVYRKTSYTDLFRMDCPILWVPSWIYLIVRFHASQLAERASSSKKEFVYKSLELLEVHISFILFTIPFLFTKSNESFTLAVIPLLPSWFLLFICLRKHFTTSMDK